MTSKKKTKKSIKYYKKLDEFVCLVVNVLDDYAYVSTMYPVTKKTIDKIKDKNK